MISNEQLVEKAFEAMKNAYAPYSNYHVGACVLCNDGETFKGANIENASYGATNCGERSAIFGSITRLPEERPFYSQFFMSHKNVE